MINYGNVILLWATGLILSYLYWLLNTTIYHSGTFRIHVFVNYMGSTDIEPSCHHRAAMVMIELPCQLWNLLDRRLSNNRVRLSVKLTADICKSCWDVRLLSMWSRHKRSLDARVCSSHRRSIPSGHQDGPRFA